jgi:hypothetical protein
MLQRTTSYPYFNKSGGSGDASQSSDPNRDIRSYRLRSGADKDKFMKRLGLIAAAAAGAVA